MALLFIDGFEQYAAISQLASGYYLSGSPMGALWGYLTGASPASIDTAGYRTAQPSGSAKSLRFYYVGSTWTSWMTLYTRAVETDLIIGCVVNSNYIDAWKIRLGSSNSGALSGSNVLTLRVNSSGYLILENNRTATTLITSSSSVFYGSTWHYVEVKVSWGISGSAEIRIDGLSAGTATGVDTRSHASDPGYVQACFGAPTSVATNTAMYFDDLYICNTSGTTNNNFLGPIKVYTLYPTSNGTTNQFTPTGAATNWDAVKEQNQDGATTYVSTSASNQIDQYNVTDMGAVSPSNIYGVAVGSWSTKTENTSRQMRHNLTVGGNTANAAIVAPIVGSYMHCQAVFETTPTGGAWTKSDVDAMQIGVESL